MTTQNHRSRLDKLEMETSRAGGFAVLYCDPNHPGTYTERNPWGKDPGRRYTEAERRELENQIERLTIIEYVDNWPDDEPKAEL